MGTFEEDRATSFQPREEVEKVAILLTPASSATEVELMTPFGVETMRGSFYLVGEGDESYGAARREFEASHRSLGDNRWVKTSPVMAYQATQRDTVETVIDGQAESTVEAQTGDWIVRQATGEVMVLSDADFEKRYVQSPSDPGA